MGISFSLSQNDPIKRRTLYIFFFGFIYSKAQGVLMELILVQLVVALTSLATFFVATVMTSAGEV
jgi:hypothetical protein